MLIKTVNLFIMALRSLTNVLEVLALKLTVGEAKMCFLNIFLFGHKAKKNLQTKPIFAYVFFFLDVHKFSMWIDQYLVKEKHKMIRFCEQFDKSKRPNIWVVQCL